jgi:branched-chain amino acid transport system permease protein
VEGLGINIKLVFTAVFTLAALLAGLAGVLGAPILTVNLGLDWQILAMALVVMVVGGLRTLQGALLGSLLIGLVDSVGKFFFPEFAIFLIFGVMAVILAFRPYGILR